MRTEQGQRRAAAGLGPLPEAIRDYLTHVEGGTSLRQLAAATGRHPATILRRVRRCESRRDDPLLDGALERIGRTIHPDPCTNDFKERIAMIHARMTRTETDDDDVVAREARRILSRMAETGAFMAWTSDMPKAVVFRTEPGGEPVRTAVVDRRIAEALVIREWIEPMRSGKVMAYRLTSVGRAALRRLQEAGDAEDAFAAQHREWATRTVPGGGGRRKRVRYNAAESPLTILARLKDRNGRPFLTPDLVEAGERLREDFEIAQMGPKITQNWDKFLTGVDRGRSAGPTSPASGPAAARERVQTALADLGPGLADIVLRCCCFLEGIEATERRLGWSARSGKVVLRIALERLKRHYEERYGIRPTMIG